jgi:DMSO/TMAO reductase YedYZ heme-binding membrane subunit
VGSLGYVALALLVATSNDRAVARLGVRRWRALHRGACWLLWLVFALSYAPGAARDPGHAAAVALLLAVAALRASQSLRGARSPEGTPAQRSPVDATDRAVR